MVNFVFNWIGKGAQVWYTVKELGFFFVLRKTKGEKERKKEKRNKKTDRVKEKEEIHRLRITISIGTVKMKFIVIFFYLFAFFVNLTIQNGAYELARYEFLGPIDTIGFSRTIWWCMKLFVEHSLNNSNNNYKNSPWHHSRVTHSLIWYSNRNNDTNHKTANEWTPRRRITTTTTTMI